MLSMDRPVKNISIHNHSERYDAWIELKGHEGFRGRKVRRIQVPRNDLDGEIRVCIERAGIELIACFFVDRSKDAMPPHLSYEEANELDPIKIEGRTIKKLIDWHDTPKVSHNCGKGRKINLHMSRPWDNDKEKDYNRSRITIFDTLDGQRMGFDPEKDRYIKETIEREEEDE
tara:strand:+ start:40498 stop:41016 length:519 start_codon:yes stop_codon:yes gene_type:complete